VEPPRALAVLALLACPFATGCGGGDLSRLDEEQPRQPGAGQVLFRGDFEDGLGGWTAQRATEERIQVVRKPHVQGAHAARFTVEREDVVAAGTGTGHRAEIYARGDLEGYPDGEGTVRYYGWCTLIPRDYPLVDSWQLIAQWKNEGPGSPPLSLKLQERELTMVSQDSTGSTATVWTGDAAPGQWHRFVARVKWSPDPKVGTIDLWHDGEHVAKDVHRATMYRDGTDGAVLPNYWKLGIYRSGSIKPPQTIFHDGAVVATTFKAADDC
jgi:hypothetical protein